MKTELITIPEKFSNRGSNLLSKLSNHKLNIGKVFIAEDGRATVERVSINNGVFYNLNGIVVICELVDGRQAFISEESNKVTKYNTTHRKQQFVQWVDETTPDELL